MAVTVVKVKVDRRKESKYKCLKNAKEVKIIENLAIFSLSQSIRASKAALS